MDQQYPPDHSLTARLQLRGREAIKTALQEADPVSCGLIAASTDMFNVARLLGDALEKSLVQQERPLEQLERLAPHINQFLQLNRVGASMLSLQKRLGA